MSWGTTQGDGSRATQGDGSRVFSRRNTREPSPCVAETAPTLLIVGLGLIGGSMAMALRGFEDYTIVGADRSEATLDYAKTHNICDRLTSDAAAALPAADVVILCLHPQGIIDFLERHAQDFKPGALILDVCGVKTAVVAAAERVLPPGVTFLGCHPMAGRECSGIQNADADLFHDAHFIITAQATQGDGSPVFFENTGEPSPCVAPVPPLITRMAAHMGFRDVVCTTPEEHDAIIAYTSQVMHVLALAVCDDPIFFDCKGFEGGSFRDCTRVAALDVPLWTELFSLNRTALCDVIERLEHNLRDYRETLASGDRARLTEKLAHASDRKRSTLSSK